MTNDVVLLIFFLCLALGVSFACSVFEAVLLSITPGYVAALEKEGSSTAQRIKLLKKEVDRPLSAILSLNTIAHTVGAAGVGAQAAKVFGDESLGIVSGVLTVLILILSEIIPKSLGASYWKRLAPLISWLLVPITWFMTITLFVPVARGITRMLGGKAHGGIPSREEISAIAEQGAREGIFPKSESRVLENLFRLVDLRVVDIMTPRTVMYGLREDTKVGDLVNRDDWMRFSRIPIHSGSLDDLTGYVLKSDVLLRAARDELDLPLKELRRELVAVPRALKLSVLFDHLLQEQSHLALVVDEYGGTAGLVTMEDLVETLVGTEIMDEADAVENMQELARRKWESRAKKMGILELQGEDGDLNKSRAISRIDVRPPADLAEEAEAEAKAEEAEAASTDE